ncbi:MAG: LLM class flavin-dependent oxidoreductase, partial [Candidatus Bathyarchaeia archaeon]
MRRKIKFGIVLANRRPVIFPQTTSEQLLKLSQMADDRNYDSVWVGDSVLAKPRLEPLTLLAAVAARTRKVKIGTACLSSFPLRHPVLVAQSWATLDQISSGRTILGVCIGGGGRTLSGEAKKEFESLGVSYEDRVKRFEEGIEIVKKLWTENTISYEGTHFQL